MSLPIVRSFCVVGLVACGSARRAPARVEDGQLTLAVIDTVPKVERWISRELRLEVRREGDGWHVAVTAAGDTLADNLLYHSREWHGPYPTQIYAWSEAERYFGNGERVLPVRGYPWVVRLRCEACKTEGIGEKARFTAGVLHIEWEPARAQ